MCDRTEPFQNAAARYHRKLCGKRLYLAPVDPDDVELYCRWLNDVEVTRNLTVAPTAVGRVGEREYLENATRRHVYAIVVQPGDAPIGTCALGDIDHLHGTCEVGIFIGEKRYWGKGYGPDALELLIGYAFDYLNMRNVMLRVFSFNQRATAAYRKLGFREMGRRRKALRREGAEHDIVYMDLLDDEFRAQRHS